MGQTLNVTMKRYNGTDSDNLLTTPSQHASTHAAGGTDPITMQTDNYANGSVTQSKLANNSVGANQLADNSVDTNALQNGAVTTAKVGTGFVTSSVSRKIFAQPSQPSWSDGDIWFVTES